MEEQYMTVCPSFKFRVPGTAISGYVTGENFEDAVKVLRKIQLGPKEIISVGFKGEYEDAVKGTTFEIDREPCAIPVQVADVN